MLKTKGIAEECIARLFQEYFSQNRRVSLKCQIFGGLLAGFTDDKAPKLTNVCSINFRRTYGSISHLPVRRFRHMTHFIKFMQRRDGFSGAPWFSRRLHCFLFRVRLCFSSCLYVLTNIQCLFCVAWSAKKRPSQTIPKNVGANMLYYLALRTTVHTLFLRRRTSTLPPRTEHRTLRWLLFVQAFCGVCFARYTTKHTLVLHRGRRRSAAIMIIGGRQCSKQSTHSSTVLMIAVFFVLFAVLKRGEWMPWELFVEGSCGRHFLSCESLIDLTISVFADAQILWSARVV